MIRKTNRENKSSVSNEELSHAALIGDIEKVKYLYYKFNINANAKDNNGSTPLINAAYNGHTDVVKFLLARYYVDVNARDKNGDTALIVSAKNDNVEIVNALLANDAIDVNAISYHGDTALISAASCGAVNAVKALLVKDTRGNEALMAASSHGHVGTVKALLAIDGINVNYRNGNNDTPLICAARNNHSCTVKALLAKVGVQVHAVNKDIHSALTCALEKNHINTIKVFLSDKHNKKLQPKLVWIQRIGFTLVGAILTAGIVALVAFPLINVAIGSLVLTGAAALGSFTLYKGAKAFVTRDSKIDSEARGQSFFVSNVVATNISHNNSHSRVSNSLEIDTLFSLSITFYSFAICFVIKRHNQ